MSLDRRQQEGHQHNQLHRTLGVTLKTAWFLSHRIREAMRDGELAPLGRRWRRRGSRRNLHRPQEGRPSRGAWLRITRWRFCRLIRARHRQGPLVRPRPCARPITIIPIVKANVARETALMTDEANALSRRSGRDFASHGQRQSQRRRVRSRRRSTPTPSKASSRSSSAACAASISTAREKHLHRYLAEFDFRYSNRQALGCDDEDRADRLLPGIVGKRLTYQTASARADAKEEKRRQPAEQSDRFHAESKD